MANPIEHAVRSTAFAGQERISGYQRFFTSALDRHLIAGRIAFSTPAGTFTCGNADLEPVQVQVHSPDFFRKVVCSGNLGLGESYMAGDFRVGDNRLEELLTLLLKSDLGRRLRRDAGLVPQALWLRATSLLFGVPTSPQCPSDIGEDLFDSFLEDRYRVYTCGYAQSWDDEIETLPRNRLDRICRTLRLRPGQRFLDIGCGSGRLILHAALKYEVQALGITTSRRHYERAKAAIAAQGLAGKADVVLGDLGQIAGRFERIASVGMLEHVPPRQYGPYFSTIERMLHPGGWALAHAIALGAENNRNDPFIQKYVFTGWDSPGLSAMTTQIAADDLSSIDAESLCRHYALTTRRWLAAFRANRHRLDPQRYGTTFQRMWEYYLCMGVAAALTGRLGLHQVLMTKDYQVESPLQHA